VAEARSIVNHTPPSATEIKKGAVMPLLSGACLGYGMGLN
jgi:hypothetical protein